MTATDFRPSTKEQRAAIMKNCAYQVDTKNEYVQWVTGDNDQTSLRAISYEQAQQIIDQQTGGSKGENWGLFDKNNSKHLAILSLLRQAQWTVPHARHGEVPDLDRLSDFLKSERSPVRKPLMKMNNKTEVPKVIKALEGVVIFTYNKHGRK